MKFSLSIADNSGFIQITAPQDLFADELSRSLNAFIHMYDTTHRPPNKDKVAEVTPVNYVGL